ncbi:glycosyltransferase family 4 protein [Lactiplantibacillus plantarum]|nr:glycosyltransferase family 4 protein [Lactiplantibacillus plantarum]MCT4461325.1 glycosyltransferase family 4 protein [Lactiplantibacillus plantarum]
MFNRQSTMLMKILITVENLVMDGVKRAATVLGNALTSQAEVAFYSLAQPRSFYELSAPLITARQPASATVLNYFGADPLTVYAPQIDDLLTTIGSGAYDAVILPGGLLTSFAPAIKQRFPRVNVIAWMHNNVDIYLNQYYVQMQDELVAGLLAADTVVTLTDYDWEGYSRFNAHTVKFYNPPTMQAHGQQADLAQHIIAYTGRIDLQHKGLDYLLTVARALPDDWQIAVAGTGPEDQLATFNRLMAELDVRDRIIYRGALKDTELRAHYQQASVFMMTSRWEGMPLVMGEAMTMGLPIVSMWNTGSAEYLQGGQYGVLTPARDVNALITGLMPLLTDFECRAEYAARARQRSHDFTLSKIVRQWLALLNRQYVPQTVVESNWPADLSSGGH